MFRKKFKSAARVIARKNTWIQKNLNTGRFYNRRPAPELVPDILEQIFYFLCESDEDDTVHSLSAYPDLFSCIQIRKSWAATAIPLLHKHPWRLDRLYTLRTTDLAQDKCKLVLLYLTLLDPDERASLLEKGIELPEPNHSPMYNYPSFVKYLDYGVMVSSVWTMYSTSCYTYDTNEWVPLVVRSLLRLFLRHSGRLTWLRCAPMSFSFDEMYYSVLGDPEFKGLLSSAQYLVAEANLGGDKKLFKVLSDTSVRVKHLELRDLPRSRNWQGDSSSYFTTNFSAVIESQTGLELLTLKECAGYLGAIIKVLPTQSKTLRTLKFIDCDFRGCMAWQGIAQCQELKRIEFVRCINVTPQVVAPLFKARFPNLKKVVAYCERDQPVMCSELMSWACQYP